MSNIFDEMRHSLAKAKAINRAVDVNSSHMAEMLVGRLRHVSPCYLKQLKKELRGFDAARQVWK